MLPMTPSPQRTPPMPVDSNTRSESVGRDQSDFVTLVICRWCAGEFDEAEWDADTRCPECEQKKEWTSKFTVRLPPALEERRG